MKTKTVEEFWQDYLHPSGSEKTKDHLKRLITEAMDQARREENEACAAIADKRSGFGSALITAIEIRARVDPPKPVWCEHITRNSNEWIFSHTNNGRVWHMVVPSIIDICPVAGCHKPRPKE